MKNASSVEKTKEGDFSQYSSVVVALLENARVLSDTRTEEESEISRLEAALLLAKEKNRKTLIKQTTLDISISAENRKIEVRITLTLTLTVILTLVI